MAFSELYDLTPAYTSTSIFRPHSVVDIQWSPDQALCQCSYPHLEGSNLQLLPLPILWFSAVGVSFLTSQCKLVPHSHTLSLICVSLPIEALSSMKAVMVTATQ